MNNFDFKGVYAIISKNKNPEFWHAYNNTHPGPEWSIKTIIPKPEFADDNIKYILYGWVDLYIKHPTLVTWTKEAFDWNGNNLAEWQTIWIKNGYDVIRENTKCEGKQGFKLTTLTFGKDEVLESIVDNLKLQIDKTMDKTDEEEYTKLLEIVEAMLSNNEHEIQEKRKNIKVVED